MNSCPKIVRPKKQSNLIRHKIYSLEEVLPFTIFSGENKNPKDNISGKLLPGVEKIYDGKLVYMTSLRYQLFAKKGTTCVTCGLVGTFFALEKHHSWNIDPTHPSKDRFHFNLYGIDAVKDEVLITKDHILPLSKEGKNKLHNLQPMCYPCNQIKDDKI